MFPSWRNGIRAALRTQCLRDIPVRVRGKGPTELCGRGENGRRGPKTLSIGSAEKGYAGNEQRPTVADAPNGYFSGSLGKRVSKLMLPSSNDRSSANCRFESCRPHQFFRDCALLVGTGRHAALKTRCSLERAGSNPAERTTSEMFIASLVGIGIHAALKTQCLRACRFESGGTHHRLDR